MCFLFTMSDRRKTENGKQRTDNRRPDRSRLPNARRSRERPTKPVVFSISDLGFLPWVFSLVVPSSASDWWSQTGSNRRPHACKARALPTELWPRRRTEYRTRRTRRTQTIRLPFSVFRRPNLVGLGGLEPPTSRLSSARSNQLSYKPLSEDRGRSTEHGISVFCCPSSDIWKKERRRGRFPAECGRDFGRLILRSSGKRREPKSEGLDREDSLERR